MKDKSKKSTYSTTFGVDPTYSTTFGVDPCFFKEKKRIFYPLFYFLLKATFYPDLVHRLWFAFGLAPTLPKIAHFRVFTAVFFMRYVDCSLETL